MAANVTLRVGKSTWVKKWSTGKSPLIASVWSTWWTVSQIQCEECFPRARCPFPGRARSPSSRTKCSPKSWRLPACLQSSPETQRCCGRCFCGGGSRRGGSSCCFWQPSQTVTYCAWWFLNAHFMAWQKAALDMLRATYVVESLL